MANLFVGDLSEEAIPASEFEIYVMSRHADNDDQFLQEFEVRLFILRAAVGQSVLSGAEFYCGQVVVEGSAISAEDLPFPADQLGHESRQRLAGPSPQISAWTTQLRRDLAAVANRWRRCVQFDRSGNRTPDFLHR